MKEFIEKLIGRLEEKASKAEQEMNYYRELSEEDASCEVFADAHEKQYESYCGAIDIVNQLAEEHKGGWIEELLEAKKNCGEDSDCSECPFGQIEDRCILAELQIEGGNNGWIPCSERLPEEDGWYYTTEKYGNIVVSGMCKFRNGKWEHCDSDITTIAWRCKLQPYKEREEVPIEM